MAQTAREFGFPYFRYHGDGGLYDVTLYWNLLEYSYNVSTIVNLVRGKKLNLEEAYQKLGINWKLLKRSRKGLKQSLLDSGAELSTIPQPSTGLPENRPHEQSWRQLLLTSLIDFERLTSMLAAFVAAGRVESELAYKRVRGYWRHLKEMFGDLFGG